MAYEDEKTYNLDAYIAHHIYIPNIKSIFNLQIFCFYILTVELSARFDTDDRPVLLVVLLLVDDGDDAGVDDECKYGQSGLAHVLAKRHGG